MIPVLSVLRAVARVVLILWSGAGALIAASLPLWLAGGLCRDLSAVAGLACCLAAGMATAALTAPEGDR